MTQLRARGFGILVPEHVEEVYKLLESLGKKEHAEAVIFLLQEIVTFDAVQLIADGEGGATGEFVRLFVVRVPPNVQELTQHSPVAVDHPVRVPLLKAGHATLSVAVLIVDGGVGVLGEVVPNRVEEEHRAGQELLLFNQIVEEQGVRDPLLKAGHATLSVAVLIVDGGVGVLGEVVPNRVKEEHRAGTELLLLNQIVEEQGVRDLLLKINRVTISAAPKTANGESGIILESVRPHVGRQDFNCCSENAPKSLRVGVLALVVNLL